MQTVKGKYKNGRIQLSRKPRVQEEVDVTVIFHDHQKKRWQGFSQKQFQKLNGIVSLGGNAIEDTEHLYS
jgi:hypothetical protein